MSGLEKLHHLPLKGTMCRCEAACANAYTGGCVDAGAHHGVAQERNLGRRKARSGGPVFPIGTCQSLLMGNERQKTPIGHRDPQSAFS
uniref:Uncharacterized protein n=1 Tax=Rhipicephalus zambeziensis TaxID=60191 RepID=A0A224YAS9_9ACAR